MLKRCYFFVITFRNKNITIGLNQNSGDRVMRHPPTPPFIMHNRTFCYRRTYGEHKYMNRETEYHNRYIRIKEDLNVEKADTDIKHDLEKSMMELYDCSLEKNGNNEKVFVWFEYLIHCTHYFDTVPEFMLKSINSENYKSIVDVCLNWLEEEKQVTAISDEFRKVYRFLLEVLTQINDSKDYKDVRVRINIAKIYRKLGESEKSIKIYRSLVYSNNSTKAAFLLVELYKERINALMGIMPSEAIRSQKELLELFRYMHRQTGSVKPIKEEFYKRMSGNYNYTKLVCEEADYFRNIKEFHACYQLLNVAIDNDRRNSNLWNELGKLYEEQQDNIFYSIEKAQSSYENAYALLLDAKKGEITKEIILSIARTSLQLNDYDKTERMCYRLLRMEKGNPRAIGLLRSSKKSRKETKNVG